MMNSFLKQNDPAGAADFHPLVTLLPAAEAFEASPSPDFQLEFGGADGSLTALRADGTAAAVVAGRGEARPGTLPAEALFDVLRGRRPAEVWAHVLRSEPAGAGSVYIGYCTFLDGADSGDGGSGYETAVCGGSSIRAPMRVDIMRSLRSIPQAEWPDICIVGDGDAAVGAAAPMCFAREHESLDRMNCIGLVTAFGDGLPPLLRSGPVSARVVSFCGHDGEPCEPGDARAAGFLVRYRTESAAKGILDAALLDACREGRGNYIELKKKADYLKEQAVPEPIIFQTLGSIVGYTQYPQMIPDPPVKFTQGSSFGELTRALAYRLCGMNLRLVGNKGCGKNTLMQTIDWLLGIPQYRMQGNSELDKIDFLGSPTIEQGTMRYQLSDMLVYLRDGADVVLDEGNTIKPECADVLHSLTDEARQIEVPGYGLVKMHARSSFTITMNEDYAGTNFMNEATVDRFTPIQMSQPKSIVEILRRVVPQAPDQSLRICDAIYCSIRNLIQAADGLEPEAMTIRGFIDALRAEPLLGLKIGLLDNVANKPQDSYTRMQLTELIESMTR